MNPILLDLGVIKIYWYSVCIFLAILVGGSIILRESKKFNVSEDFMLNLFFWDIIIAFIGARLYFVAFNWSSYSNNLLDIIKVWEGGLAIHGAIIFGAVFAIIYTKKYKVSSLLILDFIVVGMLIGQAIGRWGNFFNGEAHGSITTLETLKNLYTPSFVINGMHIDNNYYLPMFLYESIWCLIGFVFLLFIRRNKYIKVGQITSIYMIWYGIGRFFIEYFRTDSLMLGNFKVAQIVSILLFIIGIIMLIVLGKGSKFQNQYNQKNVEEIKF